LQGKLKGQEEKMKTLPLEGITVLDFTRATAGPYGSLLLADLGAKVIRIEPTDSEEREHRAVLDNFVGDTYGFQIKGIGTHFLALNRNKESIALNMRSEGGREIFRKLVPKADVVYSNYGAGVDKKMGIDYETLKEINPRIITCAITGYGPTGPLSRHASFDTIAQAMAGGMSLTTDRYGEPIRPGIPYGDLGAGLYAAIGILAAIQARHNTGEGQEVNVSILDGQVSLLIYMITDYFASGEVWGPAGIGKRADATHSWYKCKDGGYIAAAAAQKKWFEGLCRVIGREDLITDPRFKEPEVRAQNREALKGILEEAFLKRSVSEWEKLLLDADVPCGAVNTLDKAVTHPQVIHQEMVASFPHPLGGEFKAAGNPIKISGQGLLKNPPPVLGQHTVKYLRDLLGYSEEQLTHLKKEGTIWYP
jgi:crotonobetainyl-CoA:carnitine CoA-transferase CaiB-like acyl-CoA transferase